MLPAYAPLAIPYWVIDAIWYFEKVRGGKVESPEVEISRKGSDSIQRH